MTYFAYYDSEYEDEAVKIDILCDPSLAGIPQRAFPAGTRLQHFDTRHDVTALDAGALMVDKLTSLALNTLGYPPQKAEMIHKQIYDVGRLLRSVDETQVAQAAITYKTLLARMGRYPEECGSGDALEPTRVALDAHVSMHAIVRDDPYYMPGKEFSCQFSSFEGAYRGNLPYTEREHTEDLLLVSLFAKRMAGYISGRTTATSLAKLQHSTQQKLGAIKDLPVQETRSQILASLPRGSPVLRAGEISLQRMYLLSEIENTEMPHPSGVKEGA